MPLTATTPKTLLPLKSRPILEHIIERAKLQGFRQLVISEDYLAEVIFEHFGDDSPYGVTIHYLHEQQPLGTAGALAALPSSLRQEPVVETNADVITDVAYGDLFREGVDGLMAMRLQEWQNLFRFLRTEGNRFWAWKKSRCIDTQEMPACMC